MRIQRPLYFLCAGLLSILLNISCREKKADSPSIVQRPEQMDEKVATLIRQSLEKNPTESHVSAVVIADVQQQRLVNSVYTQTAFSPKWCSREKWLATGDSLYDFIKRAQLFGLFPEDYHYPVITQLRDQFQRDSLSGNARKDAALWAKVDLLLTHAFFKVVRDIKLGRLPQDSVTLRADSILKDDFYLRQFESLSTTGIGELMTKLEPRQRGYTMLKAGIVKFLDQADYTEYTFVPPASGNPLQFRKALQTRLFEGGLLSQDSVLVDSAQLAAAVKKFQQKHHLAVDGRAGEGTVRRLNENDRERFVRIAISMDKYKMLPEKMPSKYIWVNASANSMEVIDDGEVKLTSRVICGKPKTRTPLLTSHITEIITYPQWVPPQSIVLREILPAVKKNPGYLGRKGFTLIDREGNPVDPYSIDWTKYSKSIPYRIVQGSGDGNALGILKFVFSNKYSVYLHDTNQRYLFGNAMRSLSHGCVRVQEWEKLAYYILQNDSLHSRAANYTRIDSVKTWLQRKEKKNIALRNRITVYIRYFTCEGKDGEIVFYDDIYAEDKMLRDRYFASK